MSKLFLIGDTHFLHDNIIKYCDRPEDHEERMIRNWNLLVSEMDTVIHLGDVAAGIKGREDKLIDIFDQLNGNKILIRGNHDHKSAKFYKEKLGFEDVCEYMIMGDVLFYHYPLRINEYSSEKEIINITRTKKLAEENNIKHIVHGHVHQRTTDLKNHYNVSVEAINYSPIEINQLLPQL